MLQAHIPVTHPQPSPVPAAPATKTAPVPLDANLLRQISGGVLSPRGYW